MRYIIKNCPNCWTYNRSNSKAECGLTYTKGGFKNESESVKYCKDINDCLLKQIVEKCKGEWEIIDGNPKYTGFVELGMKMQSKNILDLLDIEECEDE